MNKFTHFNDLPDEAPIISRPGATAVKALDESGRVGGYLVAWGDENRRDLHGEWFTPNTEFALDWYGVNRPALYHHGLDGNLQIKMIGVIDSIKADSVGLWAEAQLDLRNEYVKHILGMVKRGLLGWSSGSLSHLVEVLQSGEIKRWPIVEGSLTPTPADPSGTMVTATIKAVKSAIELEAYAPPETPAEEPAHAAVKEPVGVVIAPPTSTETPEIIEEQMEITEILKGLLGAILAAKPDWTLTPEEESQILQSAAQQVAAQDQTMAAPPPTPQAQVAFTAKAAPILASLLTSHFEGVSREAARVSNMIKSAADEALAAIAPSPSAGAPSFSGRPARGQQPDAPAPQITQMRTKFAHLSAEDMSFYLLTRNAVRTHNNLAPWTPDSAFMRELADKAGKAYEAGRLQFGDEQATTNALKSINFLKANELNYSTQANYGDEWVPDLWSSQLWEKARMENVVLPQFQQVEMPSNPYEYPTEGSDPTVYHVPEITGQAEQNINTSTTAIPSSKIGSGKIALNAKKLALRVGFSAELVEDSIIGVIAQYRAQAMRAMQDSIDNVLLNGDTEAGANTNINLIDGTPATSAKYMALDGLRKLWAVTTTANGVDNAGAAPTLAQIRAARFKIDRAYAGNPDNLVLITHSETYAKLIGLSEFITMDKAGPNATAMTGQIGIIDGMPVVVSNEYALTNSAGKIPGAGGTLGSVTIAVKQAWYVGFRRKINVSLDFIPYYDSYQLTATVRLAFSRLNDDVSAGLYNILV